MSKHHFKEGDSVTHKDDLEHKMVVGRILKETCEFIKGFNKETNEPIKKKGIRMIGIECHWWTKDPISQDRKLNVAKFHSNELVPLIEAEKGQDHVKKWLG